MRDPEALAVIHAAVNLTRSHPHAPALDVLDLVMRGRGDQVLDFTDPAAPNASTAAELAPNFRRPNRQPAQDALNTRIFELLMTSRLMPTPQIEALVDKLMELARANHDRLMKA